MARAMATDPALLLLDEVTAALDPELTGEVLEIMRRLAGAGTTMVLATHEMAFARDVATKVCFLARRRDPRAGPARGDLRQPARGAHPPVPAQGAADGRGTTPTWPVIPRGRVGESGAWWSSDRGPDR